MEAELTRRNLQIRNLERELETVAQSEKETRESLDQYKAAIEKWQSWKDTVLSRQQSMNKQKELLKKELGALMDIVEEVKPLVYQDQMKVWHSKSIGIKKLKG